MSQPQVPPPAQLVVSVLSSRLLQIWPEVERALQAKWGQLDFVSEPFPFTQTHYYDQELGTPIMRRLISFQQLMEQDRLPDIKLATNALEDTWRDDAGCRQVNLDPGLLCLERLILGTGKNFTHRVYLGQGIFADLTLVYQKGGWQSLPWTFPDYAGEHIQDLLTRMRVSYKKKLQTQ
ncbi:MAG: DUF4416 family protein [Desulfovermiculus sp.]|nr:DUF4416 family protein [Desulfovermiculus sp.]